MFEAHHFEIHQLGGMCILYFRNPPLRMVGSIKKGRLANPDTTYCYCFFFSIFLLSVLFHFTSLPFPFFFCCFAIAIFFFFPPFSMLVFWFPFFPFFLGPVFCVPRRSFKWVAAKLSGTSFFFFFSEGSIQPSGQVRGPLHSRDSDSTKVDEEKGAPGGSLEERKRYVCTCCSRQSPPKSTGNIIRSWREGRKSKLGVDDAESLGTRGVSSVAWPWLEPIDHHWFGPRTCWTISHPSIHSSIHPAVTWWHGGGQNGCASSSTLGPTRVPRW